MSKLSIIHWNDVYRVAPQKLSSNGEETIDVTQFSALLEDLRNQWPVLPNGKRDGLVLFSGDVFSPSVESSVTRGSHMVPVMNELAPDASLTGNHDFDFGYPHLCKLIQDTKFPWILSNIIDNTTSHVPEHLHEFQVFKRGGICIGVIGLVEKEWIETVATWPTNFVYKDMTEVGIDLSRRLRDPHGEYKCDLIIALTHSRIPNDIQLARNLLALSPYGQTQLQIGSSHGVDLVLGGHDHLYYVSKGVSAWENFDVNEEVLGAENDHGDILIVKSGTDFRDLSALTLDLYDAPSGSIRKKLIKRITGTRHTITPSYRSSPTMKNLLKTLLDNVSSTLKAPVCRTTVTLDVRSQFIRTAESASGNWFADIIRHSYDDALCMKGCGGSDGVFICAGTLRGDSTYGPGIITLGNILEILPFEDPIVVLELDGAAIWEALESSLTTWPAQEGRFPVISGFRVSWDSRREPGNRVLGVWLLKEAEVSEESVKSVEAATPKLADLEFIERNNNYRKYKIVTREYMAEGHDGFLAFKGKRRLIDDESGSLMSTIVRKYLLGSLFVNRMAGLVDISNFQSSTRAAISREKSKRDIDEASKSSITQRWKQVAKLARHWSRSRSHYQEKLNVSTTEHMSAVDACDGRSIRKGVGVMEILELEADLLMVSPSVDGRLKDKALG
ncbi:Metallo-dependent phosphatase-like protein [Collybia nuda]|uniref:Metallo-dependent phosphatase-like protein n=1 Tax=Collybia nuda TaxID=64659 RepID=A0A9P5XZ67_9AGAR|nr:Metallo-dependent phosphatase-like protein [Collybia nuda]